MENMAVLAVSGCIISAVAVFIFMQFRRYDEQQESGKKILQVSTEFESTKAKLLGYTKFGDYLVLAKQHLLEQVKPLAVTVIRDYVHLEHFQKDKHKLKSDVLVIGKYMVEYGFAIYLKSDNVDIVQEGPGICIKCGQPVQTVPPSIKSASHEVSVPGVLADDRATFSEVHQKFADLAQRYGLAIAREDTLRALCKTKLVDCLRDYLAKQPGVRQVPTIVVVFR